MSLRGRAIFLSGVMMLFPLVGSVHLKKLRLKDRSFYRFIRSDQSKYKREHINRILADFPERNFILIGDSGEKDPEIYANVAQDFPDRIPAFYIRVVADWDEERLAWIAAALPAGVKWHAFRRVTIGRRGPEFRL